MVMLEVLAGATAALDDLRLSDPAGLPFGASLVLVTGARGALVSPSRRCAIGAGSRWSFSSAKPAHPPDVPGIPIWKVSAGTPS